MSKKVVLIITDGIGFSEEKINNAFFQANKPTYDRLFKDVPNSLIATHGLSVGLPIGQMGNSEVGHMSIGSGRILYQDLVKISLALKEKTFQKNEVFDRLLSSSPNLHLIGLLSDGGVHSHIDHLIGIITLAKAKAKNIYLHLISDGRDVHPKSLQKYLTALEPLLSSQCQIATLGGRFYAMDRDNRWDRIELAFNAISDAVPKTLLSPHDYTQKSYDKNELDEFILPSAFGNYEGIKDGDAILTFNFRSDRMRELTSALGDINFNAFKKISKKINLATITEYDKSFTYDILFKKDTPKNTLAEVISNAGLRQLHTAETEKYAHVTFFLNGGVDEPFKNETRVLLPSPNVKTYDMQPEMNAKEVGKTVVSAIKNNIDLVIVNFANGDMVGHTGVLEAGIKAVEAVDRELGLIRQSAKENDYAFILTSDHGNCEEMRDKNGEILTNHTVGDVWCFIEATGVKNIKNGGLNNIAPSVLKIMGLPIPPEMDEALF